MTLRRKVVETPALSERLSITVLPFEHHGDISSASLAFQENLIDALIRQARFQVVERRNLTAILKEHNLYGKELFGRNTALKLGNLIAAQVIITGNITETEGCIMVAASAIDTRTSEVLSTQHVFGVVQNPTQTATLAQGLAIKFHNDFPRVAGNIVEKKEGKIWIDLGRDLLRSQKDLIVYTDKPVRHPITRETIGQHADVIGHARISHVMENGSEIELLDCHWGDVETFDKVVAK
jgi:TolB-like protein